MGQTNNRGAGSFPLAPLPSSQLQNTRPLLLPKWRSALAKVRSNSPSNYQAKILCIGDSTTYGLWSNGSLATGDQQHNSYPTRLSDLIGLATNGRANANSFFGGGGSNPRSGGLDSRLTFGGGWTADGWLNVCLGGGALDGQSAGTLSFTPSTNVDTFNVYYIRGSGGGVFGLNVNGGSSTSCSTVGSDAVIKQTMTAALGANTLNATWTSGQSYIIGIEAYNSAQSNVNVINTGVCLGHSYDIATTGPSYAPSTFLANYPVDLNIINIGINDWDQGTSISTYTTSMQTIITAAKGNGGDVVIMTPCPSSVGNATMATQQTFITAMQGLATSNNITLVDTWARWVSYVVSNPLGIYAANGFGIHPNEIGYADQAAAIAATILSV